MEKKQTCPEARGLIWPGALNNNNKLQTSVIKVIPEKWASVCSTTFTEDQRHHSKFKPYMTRGGKNQQRQQCFVTLIFIQSEATLPLAAGNRGRKFTTDTYRHTWISHLIERVFSCLQWANSVSQVNPNCNVSHEVKNIKSQCTHPSHCYSINKGNIWFPACSLKDKTNCAKVKIMTLNMLTKLKRGLDAGKYIEWQYL